MFLCGTNCLGGEEAHIEATPSAIVPKRDHARSWSDERRVISDLRRVNPYFDNTEVYPAELPTVRDLPNRILSMGRKFP